MSHINIIMLHVHVYDYSYVYVMLYVGLEVYATYACHVQKSNLSEHAAVNFHSPNINPHTYQLADSNRTGAYNPITRV